MDLISEPVRIDANAGLSRVFPRIEEVGNRVDTGAESHSLLSLGRRQTGLFEKSFERHLEVSLRLTSGRSGLWQVLRNRISLFDWPLGASQHFRGAMAIKVLVIKAVSVSMQAVDAGPRARARTVLDDL